MGDYYFVVETGTGNKFEVQTYDEAFQLRSDLEEFGTQCTIKKVWYV